jgi:hypothetical protein
MIIFLKSQNTYLSLKKYIGTYGKVYKGMQSNGQFLAVKHV